MAEFSHLLKALRAGCPPHAGFALGFDRFAAVLSGSSSVRDVIAFPKNNKGVDEFAGGPGKISDEQLTTYHLQLRKK
ncbi:Aspartate--tRNA ligase like protein [Verticillium longisporum]|uniref:Aspartate--tRNA ligase like protein n=2 Tax=Verticillium TaxID=1036719 RepID=A0A8I3AEP8_VERLO|nr:Aspartate--tRNA ligase like protein [Verticillium longisporum]